METNSVRVLLPVVILGVFFLTLPVMSAKVDRFQFSFHIYKQDHQD